MPISSLFSTKKKPLNYTPAPVQSTSVKPKQTSSPSQSSAYSFLKPLTKQQPTTQQKLQTQGYKPLGATSQLFGSRAVMLPQKTQGSGYGSNYASNPSNYRPPQAQTQTQTQGQPQPTQDDMMKQRLGELMAPTNQFLESQRAKSAERERYEQEQRRQYEEMINKQFGITNEALRSQIPELQQSFERFKGTTMEGLSDLEKAALAQKGQIEDYYGDAQRQAMQARNQAGAQTMQKFAAQGAIDSAGAGSHLRAQENIESDFNRTTQQFLQQKAGKLSDIDTQLVLARRNATELIAQEESNLRQTIAQINQQLAGNELAKGEAIRQAYDQAQRAIFNIQDQLEEIEYQGNVQKMNAQQELQQMMSQSDGLEGLSAQFIATGEPQTEADYIYRLQNPDKVSKLGSMTGGQKSNSTKEVLELIDKIKSGNIGGITGMAQYSFIPGSQAALTKNYYDQLKAMLSLENREKMKGSGAISDFEAKVLADASSALGRNLSETQFRQVLDDMASKLSGVQQTKPSLQSFIGG